MFSLSVESSDCNSRLQGIVHVHVGMFDIQGYQGDIITVQQVDCYYSSGT